MVCAQQRSQGLIGVSKSLSENRLKKYGGAMDGVMGLWYSKYTKVLIVASRGGYMGVHCTSHSISLCLKFFIMLEKRGRLYIFKDWPWWLYHGQINTSKNIENNFWNEVLVHAKTWVNLDSIMLGESSQTKYHLLFHWQEASRMGRPIKQRAEWWLPWSLLIGMMKMS